MLMKMIKKKEKATSFRKPSGQSPSAFGVADKPQPLLALQDGVREIPNGNNVASNKALSDVKDTSCHTSSGKSLCDGKDNSRKSPKSKPFAVQKDTAGNNARAVGLDNKSSRMITADTSRNDDKAVQAKPKILTPQAQMFEAFKALYQAETDEDYLPRKDEFVRLAGLIGKYGSEAVKRKIQILHVGCKNAVFWFTKNGFSDFTIGKVVRHWNELLPIETQEQKDKRKLDELLKKMTWKKTERNTKSDGRNKRLHV
jgi:hypothetical protein